MSANKEDMKKISEKFKTSRESYIDAVAGKSSDVEKGREEKIKHRKITLSLPEDVVKLLWVMKAERGYSSISQIVAEAVREFSKKQE